MKFFEIKKKIQIFTDLKFAIFLLIVIAISSSLGSFLEQDEALSFYQEKYKSPIYGLISSDLIINLGLDHIYKTWWFFFLLALLGFCLSCCTITRQFPLFFHSKKFFFKQHKKSFRTLPFFIKFQTLYSTKEILLLKIKQKSFYIYQKKNLVYGYKGLIGRISPILVHLSLIILLVGSSLGAFKSFKAQEILPKGELFNIQNPIGVGRFTSIPILNARINDFWVEYDLKKIRQFYSNISILNNFGTEIFKQTISVNNPLRYQSIDFYQSDWNLVGLRVQNINEKKLYEFPIFSLKKNAKSWITWIKMHEKNYSLIFEEFQNTFLLYNQEGIFLGFKNIGDILCNDFLIVELIPSTGLLLKYDSSISIIYFGFGLLMLTTSLSFLPYTQMWILSEDTYSWLGGITNRGKIRLEIEFENLIRSGENLLSKNCFKLKKNNFIS